MPFIPPMSDPAMIGSILNGQVQGPMGPVNAAAGPGTGSTGQQQNPTFGQRIGGMFQNPQFLTSLAAMLTASLGGKYGGYAGQGAMQQQQVMNQEALQRQQQASMEEYRRQQTEIDRKRAENEAAVLKERQRQYEETQADKLAKEAKDRYDKAVARLAGLITPDMTPEQAIDSADRTAKGAKLGPQESEQLIQEAMSIASAKRAGLVKVYVDEENRKTFFAPKDKPYETIWLPKAEAMRTVKESKTETAAQKEKGEKEKQQIAMWIRDIGSKRGIKTPEQMTDADIAEAEGWYNREVKAPAAGILVPALTPSGPRYIPRTAAGGELSASALSTIEGESTKYEANPIVRRFANTAESISILRGVDPKTTNPGDHIQMVYLFAKALDPESVVREGEYATIKKYAQSYINRYGKEIEMALAGNGFLSEAAIKGMMDTLEQRYSSMVPMYRQVRNQTSSRIKTITGGTYSDNWLTNYEVTITPRQTKATQGSRPPLSSFERQ